jgi:hypothetical protein
MAKERMTPKEVRIALYELMKSSETKEEGDHYLEIYEKISEEEEEV